MDCLSPWLVGRFSSKIEFNTYFKQVIIADLIYTQRLGQSYAPTVWPGFSWHNLQAQRGVQAPLNQIPRMQLKDTVCFWEFQAQVYINDLASRFRNLLFLFGAMFDEFDEGTAMIKAASTSMDIPREGNNFLYLSIDGNTIPSDYYLALAGNYTARFNGNLIAPNHHASRQRGDLEGNINEPKSSYLDTLKNRIKELNALYLKSKELRINKRLM